MFKILTFFFLTFAAICTDQEDRKIASDSNSTSLKVFACKVKGLD